MLEIAFLADQRLPIYQRLKDALAARIASGEWRPGDPIPPETVLAEEHKVAVGTVRKAIEGLVIDGLVERKQGRGTFVRRADFSNALFRFFRFVGKDGRPIQPQGQLLSKHVAPAEEVAAKALGLEPHTPILALHRLRLADGETLVTEDISLPLDRFGALANLPDDQFSDLLYPMYERLAGQVIARAREQIGFGRADERIAKALNIKRGDPVVVIERTALSYDGAPLEWRRSQGAAERFSYQVEIR